MYSLILKGDIDGALKLCAHLFSQGETDQIISTLILVGAAIGSEEAVHAVWDLWNDTLAELEICANWSPSPKDQQNWFTDVAVLLVKLCLLCRRVGAKDGTCVKPFHGMRKQIIDQFRADAKLTPAGIDRYSPILPSHSDERQFVTVVLVGLSKLWDDAEITLSHTALEYFCRKKTNVPLVGWPAPTPVLAAKGELMWTLWGCLMLYMERCAAIKTRYNLFIWTQSSKSNKSGKSGKSGAVYKDRIGLLLAGAPAGPGTDQWSHHEQTGLREVQNIAASLVDDVTFDQDPFQAIMDHVPKKMEIDESDDEVVGKDDIKTVLIKHTHKHRHQHSEKDDRELGF